MPIVPDDIKFYKSSTGDSEGGSIALDQEIENATLENLFPDVSVTEAAAGETNYRKFYVKNTNGSITWDNVVAWISAATPSIDDEISFGVGIPSDTSGASELHALSSNSVITLVADGPDTRTVTLVGEDGAGIRISEDVVLTGTTPVLSISTFSKLYIASVDTALSNRTISVKQGTTVRGTIASDVAPAVLYASPSVKSTGFKLGSLAAGDSQPLWVKRIVQPAAAAYSNNQATIQVEGETA